MADNSLISEEKARIRTRLKAATLDEAYVNASSRSIEQKLFSLNEWRRAGTVFIYISVGVEPCTHGIIAEALRLGKRVAVPNCLGKGIMEARAVTSLDGLALSGFGIPEPDCSAPIVQPEQLDLIVVPCVAADMKRNRLGHGGGYYDRYLKRTSCDVICLCHNAHLLEEIPVDKNDMPVSLVLTGDIASPRTGGR